MLSILTRLIALVWLSNLTDGGDAAGSDDGDDGGDDGGGKGGSDSGGGKTLTQDEVNRIATREGDKGYRRALTEVSDKLGVDVEEAAKIIEGHREAEKAKLSEADRAKAEADEAKARAEAREAAANEKLRRAELREFAAGHASGKALDVVVSQLDDAVGDGDFDDDDLESALAAIREDLPGLFTGGDSGDEGESKPASGRTPRGRRRERASTKSSFEVGAEMAAKRRGENGEVVDGPSRLAKLLGS